MQCDYYDSLRCRSCTLLEVPYDAQLAGKEAEAHALLDPLAGPGGVAWLPSVTSPQEGFRNKAKMVVAGTVDEPTLGILRPDGRGTDLRDCPLHTPGLHAALPVLAELVSRAGLTPYDVPTRRGELKHLLVTESPDGELMVRLVLRSQEPVARLRKHLPWLLKALPAVRVVSVNLQPDHKAVLEGEREIVLTTAGTLTMRVNGVALHLRPQSFFQTNTDVAAALYRQAAAWVDELAPRSVWDLYCGVGGFALHLAGPGRDIVGVEVSEQAIESARASAAEAGLAGDAGLARDAGRVDFRAADATAYALGADAPPDLVVVNPPRRGIGAELAGWLESSGVRHVVYSSCNAQSLARDIAAMPSLRVVRGRVLDMFPNTTHDEVLVLLARG
ncbi:23S rRNA (uracil(747)-C(5))-methyltransferase RlmC [Nocardioides sp. KIGAM211]|uniref:23S rRNA (Uracil(747)-C(5))-methyltransferase RlmC n=1 Tax=Nocardioides luti TaxID=2761101 RepID=A0A7X0VAB2_9ACTN|nr:23S rRNA (uracil(747)-C(5))-methyltransferase RlmC [Nocardioides luti]MBB6627150.1 23S rRNA (uracil(747)-C(5))-methyltransferase RlmC [Nocardioides luti]